jgi:hypothetical protein
MLDYFVSQMDGIRSHFALSDFDRFRSDRASAARLLTAGMVVGKIGEGTLNLPRDYEKNIRRDGRPCLSTAGCEDVGCSVLWSTRPTDGRGRPSLHWAQELASGLGLRLVHALVGAEDNVAANVGRILLRYFLAKRHHADRLIFSVADNPEPAIIDECAGVAKIGQQSAADGDITVASGAEALVDGFAVVNLLRARDRWRRM